MAIQILCNSKQLPCPQAVLLKYSQWVVDNCIQVGTRAGFRGHSRKFTVQYTTHEVYIRSVTKQPFQQSVEGYFTLGPFFLSSIGSKSWIRWTSKWASQVSCACWDGPYSYWSLLQKPNAALCGIGMQHTTDGRYGDRKHRHTRSTRRKCNFNIENAWKQTPDSGRVGAIPFHNTRAIHLLQTNTASR